MKGHKILIPQPLRAEVLECLHATHQGVNGMSANAHQRLFWPGLDAHIRQTRAQCRSCNRISPSQPKEPLAEPSLPELPFQHTMVDLCDIRGHTYLIFTDRYTRWVEAALMPDANAKSLQPTACLALHLRRTRGTILRWWTTLSKSGICPIFKQLGHPSPPLFGILCTG